mgnify:CR=1 FL=1|jgi:hypothetical protein
MKMRLLLFCAMLQGLLSTGFSQTFVVLPSDSVSTSVDPNGSEDLYIYFENISSQAISLEWQEIVANYPPGWLVTICDPNLCFAMPHQQGSIWPFMPADSSFLRITVSPVGIPGFGLFCYDITDTIAGFSSTVCLSFEAQSVTSTMPSQSNRIQVYPNPANEVIRIQKPENDLENGSVQLRNLFGAVMFEEQIDPINPKLIDVSRLKPGVYELIYSNAQGSETQKLLIAR